MIQQLLRVGTADHEADFFEKYIIGEDLT